MNKKETRKEAYRRIIKNNEEHQRVYDDLKTTSSLDLEALATVVASIPSQEKRSKFKVLVLIYIGLMGLTVLMRCLGLILVLDGLNPVLLLLALALGVVVPCVAIYGAATSRTEFYYSTSALMVFGIFRALTRDTSLIEDPINLLAFLPTVLAVILGFILPSLLKTKYSNKMIEIMVDGEKRKLKGIVFDETTVFTSESLLDS